MKKFILAVTMLLLPVISFAQSVTVSVVCPSTPTVTMPSGTTAQVTCTPVVVVPPPSPVPPPPTPPPPPIVVPPPPPVSVGNTLRLSTINPRYFTDNSGKAIYLTGSHTWDNFQDTTTSYTWPHNSTEFDYPLFLATLKKYNHNFFRLWIHEATTTETRPLAYQRTGPGNDLKGKLKFDLTKFNQAYFDRMRARVIEAQKLGIYVDIMMFQGWDIGGIPDMWTMHPFNSKNNINGIEGDVNGDGVPWEFNTLTNPAVTALQEAYVKKVIDTVNDLDNVLYEISNESRGDSTAWQYHMIKVIKAYEATKPNKHPVGMTWQQPGGNNVDLLNSPADWISPGPGPEGFITHPPTERAGVVGQKVILNDTDHFSPGGVGYSYFWAQMMRGYNPIYMDCYCDDLWGSVRHVIGVVSKLAQRMDLARMRPRGDLSTTGLALANPGVEYAVYQMDASGRFQLTVEPGTYNFEWINPRSGSTDGAGTITVTTTGPIWFQPLYYDAVFYLKNVKAPVPPPPPAPVPPPPPVPPPSPTPPPPPVITPPPPVPPPPPVSGIKQVATVAQLQAVLKGGVSPGETVYLRAGTYTTGCPAAAWMVLVAGTQAAPITFQAYPGERAIIDGQFAIGSQDGKTGAWTVFRDLEFTSLCNQSRFFPAASGSMAQQVDIYAPNVKLINNIIHDRIQGVGVWSVGQNAEVYGNLIYFYGYEDDARGHGHAIYLQNDQGGPHRVIDNIMFAGYADQIHVYTQGGQIRQFYFEGNTVFQHGTLSNNLYDAPVGMFAGSHSAAIESLVFTKNMLYTTGIKDGGSVNLGYQYKGQNKVGTFTDNWLMGSGNKGAWAALTFTGNKLWCGYCKYPAMITTPAASPNNTFFSARPTGIDVFVRPNQYEAKRANITIYNWDKAATVGVNVSGVLVSGDVYEVRDAQNYFAPPVVKGTYAGVPIQIPMTGLKMAAPIGSGFRMPIHTAPEFGVFILRRG